LPQKDLNTKNLIKLITDAKQQLDVMAKAAKQCAQMDATSVVAQFCISEANR
jgi:UDP-N-acetylglucosamine--N-acetylmuramyl-(pentapeptide) pyrophosphoryl-undecaprenol N-acetylglucosamine transferase